MQEGRPFNAQFHPLAHVDFVLGGNEHRTPAHIHRPTRSSAWRSLLKSSVADAHDQREANFGSPFGFRKLGKCMCWLIIVYRHLGLFGHAN